MVVAPASVVVAAAGVVVVGAGGVGAEVSPIWQITVADSVEQSASVHCHLMDSS